MLCVKCKNQIPGDSVFCLHCGKKQLKTNAPKPLKRANGTGCVWKLGGRRTKPWVAEITKDFNKKTQERTRIVVGYYVTKTDALNALAEVAKAPITERYNDSLEDIYERWKKNHFDKIGKDSQGNYLAAWQKLEPIQKLKIKDLRTADYQAIIDKAVEENLSHSTCSKIKMLCGQLCKIGMQDDIINKNYASFVSLPKFEQEEKQIFTQKEIDLIKKHESNETARIILTMIYSGMRINELFEIETEHVHIAEHYMIGGEKTESGKNRIIPINDKIFPYIKEWYNTHYQMVDGKKLVGKYLIVNQKGNKKDANNFRKNQFYPFLESLGIIEHVEKGKPPRLTPHATRHTFASMMAKANAKREVLRKIIGHSTYEMTEKVYIHSDIQQMLNEINKI